MHGFACLPHPWTQANSAPTWSTTGFAIDAANEKAGVICSMPASGAVEAIGWGTRTVSVTAGPINVDVRLESVNNTTGNPSGTLLGTNSNALQAVADTDDNIWYETVLTTAPTVIQGDEVAIVIAAPGSGTFNIQISSFDDENLFHPYCALETGGTYTKRTFVGPCLTVRINGIWYPIPGATPFSNNSTLALSTTTTPDVAGVRFQFSRFIEVYGMWFQHDIDGDAIGKLVSEDYHQGNDTATLKLITPTIRGSNRAGTTPGLQLRPFTSSAILIPGTWYRSLLEPSTTTSYNFYYFTCTSASQMDGYPGGINFHMTTAKDPTSNASWTNYNNGTDGYRKPIQGLMFREASGSIGGFIGSQGPRRASTI